MKIIKKSSQPKEVWRDSKGQLAYIKGVPVKIRGGFTYVQWMEAKDMQYGSVTKGDILYIPPFSVSYE
jgi:hypothetical protein